MPPAAAQALPETASPGPAVAASATAPVDPHYRRDITALGDTHEIRARQAIWSKSRIKLVGKGVRVDSSLYDRLMQHKLQSAIEECLEIADAVSPRSLREEAVRLIESGTGYAQFQDNGARPGDLLAVIGRVPVDEPLAVRLTVMRERRPPMYVHAIGVALITAYLAQRSGFRGDRLTSVVAAGLYHDIGEMHIDPAVLTKKQSLDESDRRHVYAHPLTAFLVLQERPCCAGAPAEAVFEHHERLDGSGYPRGIRGDEISEGGRILALAELAATFFAQPADSNPLRRMPVVLKLNHRRFDHALTNHLVDFARQASPSGALASPPDVGVAVARIEAIQTVVRDWGVLFAGTSERGPAFDRIGERMAYLGRTLSEAGLDVTNTRELAAAVAEDAHASSELHDTSRELNWLLQEIVNGCYRETIAAPAPLLQWADQARQTLGAVS